ncbi:hypothetical protein PAXRUDRAFT_31494 [Paxillus rubicundulus Ve08.2h10]|uniref:Isopenicillin N synthase-like Fe(2+) 2OG dioxygenase domain-containing protein n=1 Tax=Paxillus rubicundulus Ve08.2h10 TaxID=930991 RepID=A0A0D0DUH6_9AGAM|nr:hypothetical protein PAXRUDRAFT_31494 [Paxillus rubicundulus Ve08.2h10]
MFDIADIPMSGVSEEEKRTLAMRQHTNSGVKDKQEHYDCNRDVNKAMHPQALHPFLPNIDVFAKHNHYNNIHGLFKLIALSPKLPEDTLVNIHNFNVSDKKYNRAILSMDGKLCWVKHIESALVVNTGDALDFLTGKYYKGTIHGIVQPPQDQQQYTHPGVFYFTMPNDNDNLIPMCRSPLLQRVGINPCYEDRVQEETINDVLVEHWI